MEQCADQILELASHERSKLLQYFDEVGLSGDAAGIIDIGWQASSLGSLHDILEAGDIAGQVPGFYFGTWQFARAVAEAGHPFESFFMHLDEPLRRSWIVGEAVELVETFFWAPHPTITGLRRVNDRWEAVHGERELGADDERWLRVASDAAFRFVDDALAAWPEISRLDPPYGYLETTLERLLRFPRADEAAILGGLGLRSSFGGHGPLRHVAQLPSAGRFVLDRNAYQDAYDHCYWKKGFAAQLTPRTRKYLKMR